MSAVLPEPVALDLPDEAASALSDVVAAVTGAAFRFGVLEAELAGPAATAPGWLGEDAAAAADQVGVTAAVVRDVHGALTGALDRLGRHADLLDEVRHRIAALRAQQQEDYDAAAARLAGALLHPATPYGPTQPALIVALGDELRSAELVRQRQHAALLAELRSDALDTARTLAASTAAVGGTGRSGDAGRVVAHLAVRLPGWGDGELSARGAASAAALTGPTTLEQIEVLARRDAVFAAIPAYADALLRCLGPSGVRYLLSTLGQEPETGEVPLAGLLATALGAARPTGRLVDPVAEVLAARYVQADDPDGSEDVVVLGMAAVLAAGAGRPGLGPPPTTVAAWGVQMLERERTQGRSTIEAVPGSSIPDPVVTVLHLLDDGDDPAAAATLLSGPNAWSALLARDWDDSGLLVSRIVDLAGAASGAGGEAVARSGLEALGTGLSHAGVDAWGVRPRTAAQLAPSLGRLAAGHLGVVTGLLRSASTEGRLPGTDELAVRGLGLVMTHGEAERAVAVALASWAAQAPDPAGGLLAAATLGSFVGVREYGERLAYALAGAQAQAQAVDGEFTFDVMMLPLKAVTGLAGEALGAAKDLLGHWAGLDGTWSLGPDRGARFTEADAASTAVAAVGAPDARTSAAVEGSARASFGRTMAMLGVPRPPVPEDWSDVLLEEASAGLPGVVVEMLRHAGELVDDLPG